MSTIPASPLATTAGPPPPSDARGRARERPRLETLHLGAVELLDAALGRGDEPRVVLAERHQAHEQHRHHRQSPRARPAATSSLEAAAGAAVTTGRRSLQ